MPGTCHAVRQVPTVSSGSSGGGSSSGGSSGSSSSSDGGDGGDGGDGFARFISIVAAERRELRMEIKKDRGDKREEIRERTSDSGKSAVEAARLQLVHAQLVLHPQGEDH